MKDDMIASFEHPQFEIDKLPRCHALSSFSAHFHEIQEGLPGVLTSSNDAIFDEMNTSCLHLTLIDGHPHVLQDHLPTMMREVGLIISSPRASCSFQ